MQVKSLVDASLNAVGDFIMRPSPQLRLRSSKAEKGSVAALFAGPSGSSGCTFRPLVHLGTSGFSELPDFHGSGAFGEFRRLVTIQGPQLLSDRSLGRL